MAILVDLSQVVLGSCYAFKDQLTTESTATNKQQAVDLIRHVILSQLKAYNVKYRSQYGKMIISCDGKNYWRKKLYPHYKANRKKVRHESNLDWPLIFDTINMIIGDLRNNFMFPVVQVDGAESDDVIATLTKYFQTNEVKHSDWLIPQTQPILIISSDKDFVQLQKYDNVKQLSPRTKMAVTDPDPVKYLQIKCLSGDRGDNIPSVVNPIDAFNDESVKKCAPLTKKKIESLLNEGYDNCSDPVIKNRWLQNSQLIDFEYIPKKISEAIIETYNRPIVGNQSKIFNYLIHNNCNLLLNDINAFSVVTL